MNKRTTRAHLFIDIEKKVHKELKTIALEEDKSLKKLMMEAIKIILKKRGR